MDGYQIVSEAVNIHRKASSALRLLRKLKNYKIVKKWKAPPKVPGKVGIHSQVNAVIDPKTGRTLVKGNRETSQWLAKRKDLISKVQDRYAKYDSAAKADFWG